MAFIRSSVFALHYRPFLCARRTVLKSPERSHERSYHGLYRYFRSLKWVPIPLGVGFAYIGYQQFFHVREREKRQMKNSRNPEDLLAKEWQVKLYRALPLRTLSRVWGRINNAYLPVWLRRPLLSLYVWAFDCNLDEAADRDLRHYHNLGEFFRRCLRPDCRHIDKQSPLVSPCDGKILHLGTVSQGHMEQVKGVAYPLSKFLGPALWNIDTNVAISTSTSLPTDDTNDNNSNSVSKKDTLHLLSDADYETRLKQRDEGTQLYHCVLYLSPGDYHGFHYPADWRVVYRRYFPGELLSVSPWIMRWVRGLLSLNERAVYVGHWQEGFMAVVAVGATNVGSITVHIDKNLKTNIPSKWGDSKLLPYSDLCFVDKDKCGISAQKGAPFGLFNLGSTIVLVFEAPSSFQFNVRPGDRVKFGQSMGTYDKSGPAHHEE